VKWGPIYVASCYAPPRWTPGEFETFLERLGAVVQGILHDAPIIVAGDFNAKSPAWGETRRDRRGNALVGWASEHGLCVLNRGRVSTCVRPQGESIVDITMGSPYAARMVSGWRVVKDMRGETLSDHLYIEVVLGTARRPFPRPPQGEGQRSEMGPHKTRRGGARVRLTCGNVGDAGGSDGAGHPRGSGMAPGRHAPSV